MYSLTLILMINWFYSRFLFKYPSNEVMKTVVTMIKEITLYKEIEKRENYVDGYISDVTIRG